MKRKLIAAVAIPLGAFAAAIAPAAIAGATTTGCTSGVLGAYCGDQTDGNQLAADVYQQAAKPNQAVIAYPDSSSDPATDFAWYVPSGSFATGAKQAMYTPGGKITGLCLSDPDQVYAGHAQADAIVLRACQGDDGFQVWSFNGTGWTNAKTGLVLTENGKGKALTDAAPVSGGSDTQTWTFGS